MTGQGLPNGWTEGDAQRFVNDIVAAALPGDLVCPLCGDVVPMSEAVQREHEVRGTKIKFSVCSSCAHRSLCAADYHGIHGEVVAGDDDEYDPRRAPEAMPADGAHSYCSRCYAPFQWRDGAWHDLDPAPLASAVASLNDRLQRGDITSDEYLDELRRTL